MGCRRTALVINDCFCAPSSNKRDLSCVTFLLLLLRSFVRGAPQDTCLDRVSCGGEDSELQLGTCKKCCAKVRVRRKGFLRREVRGVIYSV